MNVISIFTLLLFLAYWPFHFALRKSTLFPSEVRPFKRTKLGPLRRGGGEKLRKETDTLHLPREKQQWSVQQDYDQS